MPCENLPARDPTVPDFAPQVTTLSEMAPPLSGLRGLRDWFDALPGSAVREIEQGIGRDLLPDLFGYHLIEIGDIGVSLAEFSRVSHRVLVSCDGASVPRGDVVARPDSIPIASNAVDVVVLPHVLEFAGNAHGILREAERILIGDGHILIIGFNPWSGFGVCRRALGWRGHAPWCGRWLSPARVRDWLELLGFEVERIVRGSFRPPLANRRWHARLEFMERLGGHFWPVASNLYAILARKRVTLLRPVRTSWKLRRRLVSSGVVEPTARVPGVVGGEHHDGGSNG